MNYKYGKPYKLKTLETFSSFEWMADNKRKFRTVFEQNEIDYLNFQFEFYNKLFDEEDWDFEFTIKVLDEKNTEWYKETIKKKIPQEQNIYVFTSNWGKDKKGSYWKSGRYRLIIEIDKEVFAEKKFYINNIGNVTSSSNPYFDVVNLRLIEGGYNVPTQKKYYKIFKRNETHYIWFEFQALMKVDKGTPIEFFINVYDDAGQLKTQMQKFYFTDADYKNIDTFYSGWGNEEGDSWMDDKYYVNIVFMDQLVASTYFEIGDNFEEGTNYMKKTAMESMMEENMQKAVDSSQEKELSLDELMSELNQLIGLQSIKEQIVNHIKYLEFLKIRKEKGIDDKEKITLHSVFTGNPGTGKTTVVKLLGKIYQQLGLLSKGHVNEVNRTHLIGEFIGQTAPKTQEQIEKSKGGILFIDEAYSLFRSGDDAKDFGREAIEIIIKTMSDGPTDIAIMVAGYPQEMNVFLDSNPGLKSRFSYYFNFPDYSPDELIEISYFAAQKLNVVISEQALELLKKIIQEAYRNRDKSFGNARFAHYIVGQAKFNMGIRLTQMKNLKELDAEVISTIQKEDIDKVMQQKNIIQVQMSVDEGQLQEALRELNSMIGIDNIKEEVNEMVKLIRYYKEIGQNVIGSFSLHSVFTGNPGTGKTTIARLFGRIYKALGILEKGHIVETQRDGLIAEYVGQTAVKTKAIIDAAIGGVLFIDEAYGLTDSKYSYGSEAIEVILKNMEDKRGQFVIIVAGYTKPMETFLKSNPGLMSRFDKFFHFRDYNQVELTQIMLKMIAEHEMSVTSEAQEYIKKYIEDLYKNKDQYFGNAREIRRLVAEIIRKQNIRMADTPKEFRTYDNIRTINIDDVKHLVYQKAQQKGFGF